MSAISIQSEDYQLPDRTRLDFFRNESHFLTHLKTHFLAPEEPWLRVLPQLFPAGQLDRWNEVTMARVYDQVVQNLDEGIKFAQKHPVYARCRSRRQLRSGTTEKCTAGIYLLAKPGYVIVAADDVVCTAFFCSRGATDPFFILFDEGWKYIKAKQLCYSTQKPYSDSKLGEEVLILDFTPYSHQNWETCPNPHIRQLPLSAESDLPVKLQRAHRAAGRYLKD